MEHLKPFLSKLTRGSGTELPQSQPPSIGEVLSEMGFHEREITRDGDLWFITGGEGSAIRIEHHQPNVGEPLDFFRIKLQHQDQEKANIPQQPLAVLIHGMGLDAWSMFPLAFALADRGIPAIAVSLPGHGLSLGEKPDTLASAVDPVVALIESFDLPKDNRVIAIGHSLGVYSAIAVADRLTDKGQETAVVDLAGAYVDPGPKEELSAAARMGKLIKLCPEAVAKNFFNHKGKFLPWAKDLVGSIVDHIVSTYSNYSWLKNPPEKLRFMISAAGYSPKYVHPGIVIAGEKDRLIPNKETLSAQRIFLFPQKRGKGNTHIIKGACHMMPTSTEYSEEIADLIVEAFAK